MRRHLKRLLSLLLALTMAASFVVTGWAVDDSGGNGSAPRTSGTELEMEDLDPSTLHIPRLGEVADEEEPAAGQITVSPNDIVRVSIFLNNPATLDAGYSMQGVGSNTAAINYRESLRRQQNQVTAAIERTLGSTLDVKWNMTLAVNAISAEVRYKDIPRIGMVSGVKSVVLENQYEAPETEPAQPNTANTSENMVGAATAWNAGYTGAGSRIAIIDTGIDTTHQSFAADPFTYAVGLAGAANELMTQTQVSNLASQLNSKSDNYVSAKIPYGYNYVDKNTTIDHMSDTNGEHGSHVAGIAAANRFIGTAHNDAASTVGAVGMAPDAQLFVMKVFGAKGGAYDSDYMVAIEDAIILGCDVVNLSLGSSVQGWTYDSTYQDNLNNLANKAHNGKMVVSISAGNSYDFACMTDAKDLYKDDVYYHTGGSPGTFVNSLCVAAAQNTIIDGTPMNFNGEQDVYYYESTEGGDGTAYTNPKLTTIKGSYSYVYIDAAGTEDDYSAINRAVSLSGKVVIVNRGDISFVDKGENAKSYNPKAVIVANNQDGTIYMDLSSFTGTFPMVTITLRDANRIKEATTPEIYGGITCYTGTVQITDTQKPVVIDRSQATIADFSSWGVPGSLIMKPEITAPGGDIYSVAGTNKTGSGGTAGGSDQYENMSGTSMAAPHVAGLSAVVSEYLRENPISGRNAALNGNYSTRAIIQSLLMSTATPMKPNGEYLPILQQGAGLAEVGKAIQSPSVIMMTNEGNTLTVRTGANADGKVKAELGDDPAKAGRYTFGFTVYNLTDDTLTYELNTELFTQKISGELLTRGTTALPAGGVSYTWNGLESAVSDESHDVNGDGKTDNADVQAILDFLAGNRQEIDEEAADMDGDEKVSSRDAFLLIDWEPETVAPAGGYTVAPHDKVDVKVTLQLTSGQRNALAAYATGAYLEGFTMLTCSDGSAHSIPILGFYGSWTDPSMFDNMSYVDGLYGAERLPYSGNADTNYMMVNYNGTNVKFSGNPYMVEDQFPADRLALNSNTNLIRISYNLVRSAGTTGYAVTRLDENDKVAGVLNSAVTANHVSGMYYSNSGGWQNTGTKLYSINKTVSSYGLKQGDRFRVGYYAIPEYNAMTVKGSYNAADSGVLGQTDFNTLLTDNVLGMGAMVGYNFTVDDTAPTIETPTLNGTTLTVRASDNQNLAYVAVLSLDGTVKYAEKAPGTSAYEISFDASDAIANAKGYVAVFAGDYAGNEAAKAIKVNDNAFEEKIVYVLTDTLTAGNDYLIVSRNTAGSGYALGHSAATVASNAVTVRAGTSDTDNKVYIESTDVASTSIWTVTSGYTFKNGRYYLGYTGSTSYFLSFSTTTSREWTYASSCLSTAISDSWSSSTYYLRYSNGFSLSTKSSDVYLYQKTIIRTEIDPYGVSSVTITPNSLDLYKGNTADLIAKVIPLIARDRTVTWSSSNPSVATVDADGHVTAKGKGSATITATANGDTSKTAACTVTVTAVNKTLNGIIWDEEGDVFFSGFNANNLPTWSKLHNNPVGTYLVNAMMADPNTLYASTCDVSGTSVIYEVDCSTYALTEFGNNYAPPFGMARASSTYTDYFVYGFAKYLIFGNLTPEDDGEGGTFSGLPYGMLDLSQTDVGDAYACGVCAKSIGSTSSSFYFLDETGKIWQTSLSVGSSASFGTPTLVVDTGIGTSFQYQSLYFDGTYIYWSHQTDNEAELIIIVPPTGKVYHAGSFGEGVWPAAGLFVNGSAAPASVEDGEPMELTDLTIQATRDQLMTTEIMQRLTAETARFVSAEAPAYGGVNRVTGPITPNKPIADDVNDQPRTVADDDNTVTVDIVDTVALYNGWYTFSYDSDKLTDAEIVKCNADFYSIFTDEREGKSSISVVFADRNAIRPNDGIITVTFSSPCEDTEIESNPRERNEKLDALDSYRQTVSGIGHDWSNPDWAWAGDYSSATATFTCGNHASHVVEAEAVVTSETTPATATDAGRTVYTAAVTGPNGVRYTDVKEIVLPITGPQITKQPVDASNYQDETVTFTVEAEGVGLTYMWQCYTNSKWINTNFSGSKTPVLTVKVTADRDGRLYRCVVTDANGHTAISDAAALKMLTDTVTIVKQPMDASGTLNSSVTFTVEAEGAGLTYMWQCYTNSKWINTNFSGSKTPVLTVKATADRDGRSYRCVVTDANGHTAISDAAVLRVLPDTVTIVKQPMDASGTLNSSVTFTVEAEGVGLTYMWQCYTNSKWINTNFSGSKTPVLTVKATEERDGRSYRCVVTDANGHTAISDAAVLRVLPDTVTIVKQPIDASGTLNSSVTFTVEAEGVGLTYMWQCYTSGKWIDTSFKTSKTPELTVKATAERDGRSYRCVVTDANGHTAVSRAATLHIAG